MRIRFVDISKMLRVTDPRSGARLCEAQQLKSLRLSRKRISTKRSIAVGTLWLLAALGGMAQQPEYLAQTEPLTWDEIDLSTRLMDGAHRFVDRKIVEAPWRRDSFWARDFSSAEAYVKSVQPNRERFKTIIGAVDSRLPARMERFGDDAHPALVAETSRYRIFQVRWPVLEGFSAEGLLVQPKGETAGHVIAVPDADQTPEQLMGLAPGVRPESQATRRLAENGFEIIVPALINRLKLSAEDRPFRNSDQTHREWIYRQAFQMGRHVIGYEVQSVLAATDWFRQQHGDKVKVGDRTDSDRP